MSKHDCPRCGSGFDDWQRAELHAAKHLVTVPLELDGVERGRVVAALLQTAGNYDNLARARTNAGPDRKDIRTGLRNTRDDYRLLAEQIRKVPSRELPHV